MKTVKVITKDGELYKEVDYIDYLKLRLDIVKGKITQDLWVIDEGGVMHLIDKYGNSAPYIPFACVDSLLRNIVSEQMKLRMQESK